MEKNYKKSQTENVMKRVMLTLVLVAVCGLTQAQSYLSDPRYGADTATRMMVLERMNMMKDANDVKDPETATKHAFCFINVAPAASQNAYILVLNYYKMKVNLATELEERDMYVDSLMYYYDRRMEFFPKSEVAVKERKAMDYCTYRKDDVETVMMYLDEAIEAGQKAGAVNGDVVYYYFNYLDEIYVSTDMLATEDYLDSFDRLSKLLDDSVEKHAQYKQAMEQKMIKSGAANIENLEKMFAPKLAENPTDTALFKKVIYYVQREAPESQFLQTTLEGYFALTKDPMTALQLSGFYERKGDITRAAEYMDKAVSLEPDPERRSDLLVNGARYMLDAKKYSAAANYARQAMNLNSQNGLAYFALGQAYAFAAGGLQVEEWDRQTVYWLAADNLQRAISLISDEKTRKVIQTLLNNCSASFPTKDECFFRSKTPGTAYEVNAGWIKGSTKVRERKE
jgi:tetratricopeptide (TPR) repeat protein